MRRATLIGILGLLLVAVAYVTLTGAASDSGICILNWRAMQPFVVGDTVRYVIGSGTRDSCEPSMDGNAKWSSISDVVRVGADDVLIANRPGQFLLMTKRDGRMVNTDGYVLPRDWRVQLKIDADEAHVGDTIYIVARAVDSLGGKLIPVPNSVTARDVNGRALLRVLGGDATWIPGGVSFVAVDTGTVTLVGEIKGRQTMEPLTIVPR